MKKSLFLVFCSIIALNSVQSSVIFRRFRELDIPRDEQLIAKEDKLIGDLNKKDSIPVAIEVIEPAILVQDEIIVPVEVEKKLIDSVKEPVSVSVNEIIPQEEFKDEQKNFIKEENVNEIKIEKQELNLNKNKETSLKEKEQEKSEPQLTDQITSDDQNFEKDGDELRQNTPTGGSTSRPTIFQAAQQAAQQIISNNPLGQFIDTFRRPLTSTLSPGSDPIVVTAPNLLQQFQAGVQNFTSQFTSVFNPNAVQQQAVSSDSAASTVRPPNLIETLQTNFQNAVSSVFRPLNNSATGTNPLQVVFNPLQAVQSFFGGNRVESTQKPPVSTIIIVPQAEVDSQSSAEPSQTPSGPLDNKIDYNIKNSQEITDVQDEEQAHESDSGEHEEHEDSGEHDEIKDHVLDTAADSHEMDVGIQGTNKPENSQIAHITYNLPSSNGIQGNVEVHNYDVHEDTVDLIKDPLHKQIV